MTRVTLTSSQHQHSPPCSALRMGCSGEADIIIFTFINWGILIEILLIFRLEVDLHEFGPEDIDISVEGEQLTVLARREIKKKSEALSSVREFQEKFRIPEGVDVTRLSSEISGDGVLIITGEVIS